MNTPLPPESDAEKLRRRNRELSILNAIAEALNREVDLTRSLQSALAQVAGLLDLQTGWIWLLSEDTGGFYLAAAQNLPPALDHHPERMEGWCYCLDTFEAGDMSGAANVNVVTCTRLKGLVDGTDGLRYHASIPLYAHGKELGVLNVASADWRGLSENTLRLLHTIGDLLSIAIERARLFEQSTQLGAAEERNRLAREIHDTIAQGLAATVLQLEIADALLDAQADPVRVQQVIQKALALTRANMEEARRSVLDLRAAPLEGRTLVEALALLVGTEGTEGGLATSFEVTGENRPLPVRVEVGLYRIAQEAITNVLRHAGATRLLVRLVVTPEQAQMSIEDDGCGFEGESLPKGRYGLVGLNERTRLLGGTLEVCSEPGVGTSLHISVPLEAKL
ncbi:MAG: GAF domain-containing sensor histidine kinase [Ardenticatenales bacterium]|nr:GAF domain-containing sensor histidine kinase [Ardenticatenales bacterium]